MLNKSFRIAKSLKTGRRLIALRHFSPRKKITVFRGRMTKNTTYHSIQVDWQEQLEPFAPYKYINHSCKPNCLFRVDKNRSLTLYALSTINPEDELTVDYDSFEYRVRFMSKKKCLCSAKNCRGQIRGWKFLTPQFKKHLMKIALPYLKNV